MTLALQQFGFNVADLLQGVVNYTYYILFGFIIASILFSWFPGYPSSGFMQAVYDAVKAVTNPILSPIIAIFGLSIARTLLTIVIDNFIRPVTG
jgi:YggT family protein